MSDHFRADIHCHSIFSDGTNHPNELLRIAKDIGLQGLSITDHDTIDAYSSEFFSYAKELGIEILTGTEISSEIDDASVHILGYGFNLKDQAFQEFLAEMQNRREIRNREILRKLKMKNIQIEEDELKSFATQRTIGRPHIAELMIQKGYVKDMREAFDKYLKEGAMCYASGIKFHPEEVIETIQNAKGKAVLAHPHFFKKGKFLNEVLKLPFDGIECYYSKLDPSMEKPWLDIAKKKGWIPTGGSDYHGIVKPHITLGCSWVGREIFDLLKKESGSR